LCLAQTVFAHEEVQVRLIMSARPSNKISDWRSNRETVQLLITNTSSKPVAVRIDAKLSLGGVLVANTKFELMTVLTLPPNQPVQFYAYDIFPENAINFLGEVKQSTIRTGILPEGSYEICIQTLGALTRQNNSNSDCKQFFLTKYELPRLVLPEDNTVLIAGFEKQTNFSWVPVIPLPAMPVTYKLRVVPVLQGQTAHQAFELNIPLFERKTIGSTQQLWPNEVIIPSAGSVYAWSVQAEDMEGNPIILPERYPQPFTLKILPSKEGCAVLLNKLSKERQATLEIEERYWKAYDTFERTKQQLEEAEERADAYMMQKIRKKLPVNQKQFSAMKELYEEAYAKYDNALKAYLSCGE
jgi:hypothetical protein